MTEKTIKEADRTMLDDDDNSRFNEERRQRCRLSCNQRDNQSLFMS